MIKCLFDIVEENEYSPPHVVVITFDLSQTKLYKKYGENIKITSSDIAYLDKNLYCIAEKAILAISKNPNSQNLYFDFIEKDGKLTKKNKYYELIIKGIKF